MTALAWVGVGLVLTLLALVVVMVFIIIHVRQETKAMQEKLDKLTSLSLNPRTRVTQASMQSGARTPEQDLRKLAHTSQSRRVVVGGDEDSEQYQRMSRGIREEDNDGS